MKKLFTLFITSLFVTIMLAQSPQKMSYQAVVRNSSGALVTGKGVGMKISILQGSSGGTLIYQEICNPNPQTNENGLLTLEIGEGNPLTGTFSSIDWSDGPYYLMTEIDPSGGTSYTISGTSQLLSVPYALYANSAENYTEADPMVKTINGIVKSNGTTISSATAGTDYLTPTGSATSLTDFPTLNQNTTGSAASFTGSLAGEVTGTQGATVVENSAVIGKVLKGYVSEAGEVSATDNILQAIQKLNGNDATNANLTGDVISKGNATIIANKKTMTATAPVSITGSPTVIASGAVAISIAAATQSTAGSMSAADKTKLDGLAVPVHTIGESYGGGNIFYLDASGQHGLIAATEDQNTGIQWYNGTYRYTGTTGDGLYAGAMNTTMIVATQLADNQTGDFAAKVCADYSVTIGGITYGDWYLPSKYELNLLYAQKAAVGGFASAYYWSSTEVSNGFAWIQNFGIGSQPNSSKSLLLYVRAVRAF